MAKIYRFEQLPVYVNKEIVLADSAEFLNSSSLYADYRMNQNIPQRVYSTSFIRNELRLTYYPSYQDQIFHSIKNNAPQEYSLGGMNFGFGYVSNYGLSITPQGLVRATANINFYNNPTDKLNGESLKNLDRVFIKKETDAKDINLGQGTFTQIDQSLIKIPISLNYDFQVELFPREKIGGDFPTEIQFGKKQINLSVESEYLEKFVTLDGEVANFKIKLRDMCDLPLNQKHYKEYVKYYYLTNDVVYECAGHIQSINSSVNAGDWLKSSINMVQFL